MIAVKERSVNGLLTPDQYVRYTLWAGSESHMAISDVIDDFAIKTSI